MSTHLGKCLCGEVQFEIDGDFDGFYLCHCKYCQKDTGSAHASNLFSSHANLKWVSGQSNITTYNLPGTRHIKSFCKTCGSSVPSLHQQGKLLVVPAGGLDTEVTLTPNAHIFCDSRASWDNNLEAFPHVNGFPVK